MCRSRAAHVPLARRLHARRRSARALPALADLDRGRTNFGPIPSKLRPDWHMFPDLARCWQHFGRYGPNFDRSRTSSAKLRPSLGGLRQLWPESGQVRAILGRVSDTLPWSPISAGVGRTSLTRRTFRRIPTLGRVGGSDIGASRPSRSSARSRSSGPLRRLSGGSARSSAMNNSRGVPASSGAKVPHLELGKKGSPALGRRAAAAGDLRPPLRKETKRVLEFKGVGARKAEIARTIPLDSWIRRGGSGGRRG